MTECYLSLGSNLGSPLRQLNLAIAALKTLPKSSIIKVASFYRSKAWGRKALPDYYNTVVALNTCLCPEQLLFYCQKIEKKQGRVRRVKRGARTLDIDILIYGAQQIKTPTLQIPHPRFKEREFVMIPLLELTKIN